MKNSMQHIKGKRHSVGFTPLLGQCIRGVNAPMREVIKNSTECAGEMAKSAQ